MTKKDLGDVPLKSNALLPLKKNVGKDMHLNGVKMMTFGGSKTTQRRYFMSRDGFLDMK